MVAGTAVPRRASVIGNLLKKKAEGGVYEGAFKTPASKSKALPAAARFIVSSRTLSSTR